MQWQVSDEIVPMQMRFIMLKAPVIYDRSGGNGRKMGNPLRLITDFSLPQNGRLPLHR